MKIYSAASVFHLRMPAQEPGMHLPRHFLSLPGCERKRAMGRIKPHNMPRLYNRPRWLLVGIHFTVRYWGGGIWPPELL